jgi:hypothetical protein
MISPLPGWTFEPKQGFVQLRAEAAPAAGFIRYIERLRPSPPLPDLVRAHVSQFPRLKVLRLHAAEELRTDEGEEAALLRLDGEVDGRPLQITLGYVWVDEFCSETAAVATDAQHYDRFAAAVRQLIHGDQHMMTQRRRRYRHRGPLGWHSITRESTLNLVWLSPGDDGSEMTVAAALPSLPEPSVDTAIACHMASGLKILRHGETHCPPLSRGLCGRLWRFEVQFPDGAEGLRWVAALKDASFTYHLHCDARVAQAATTLPLFEGLLGSIEPIAPETFLGGWRDDQAGAVALFGWVVQ